MAAIHLLPQDAETVYKGYMRRLAADLWVVERPQHFYGLSNTRSVRMLLAGRFDGVLTADHAVKAAIRELGMAPWRRVRGAVRRTHAQARARTLRDHLAAPAATSNGISTSAGRLGRSSAPVSKRPLTRFPLASSRVPRASSR